MCFTRESNNDVGGDGKVGACLSHVFTKLEIFLIFVGAQHELENTVTAALHGEVNVAAQFGQVSVSVHQILAESDGVR